ncbi:hypothetical protein [Deinococcus marmoris]|uniref:Uncharacterized protein n=1 Tax=Deinococcus marmoris TaxID=249408 RepID=A0A1U7NTI0_9DEIO|nr:hypothetical protein [Deinococcus marmoris]OLV16233.1 hypothetical protein BOO71_0012547 [Deinococcus marmoris]
MTQARSTPVPAASALPAPAAPHQEAQDAPSIQTQISDLPEPMPLWAAWVLVLALILVAAFTLYLYVTTQYVPER